MFFLYIVFKEEVNDVVFNLFRCLLRLQRKDFLHSYLQSLTAYLDLVFRKFLLGKSHQCGILLLSSGLE